MTRLPPFPFFFCFPASFPRLPIHSLGSWKKTKSEAHAWLTSQQATPRLCISLYRSFLLSCIIHIVRTYHHSQINFAYSGNLFTDRHIATFIAPYITVFRTYFYTPNLRKFHFAHAMEAKHTNNATTTETAKKNKIKNKRNKVETKPKQAQSTGKAILVRSEVS